MDTNVRGDDIIVVVVVAGLILIGVFSSSAVKLMAPSSMRILRRSRRRLRKRGYDPCCYNAANKGREKTDSAEIVRMDVGLHWLVKIKLEECRARWGECFELLCLERNWGSVLDDRQVLRLARQAP